MGNLEPCAALEAAAKSGECGLLTVELDRRPGDDVPRVAIKRFQPLDSLAKRTRLQMEICLKEAGQVPAIANELAKAKGGTGIVRFRVTLSGDRKVQLLAGRDFTLDADLAARIERLLGPDTVELSVQTPPQLAIVA
jgi:DNA polymerase-3 subunit alpha